jgi:hypothetical protein
MKSPQFSYRNQWQTTACSSIATGVATEQEFNYRGTSLQFSDIHQETVSIYPKLGKTLSALGIYFHFHFHFHVRQWSVPIDKIQTGEWHRPRQIRTIQTLERDSHA